MHILIVTYGAEAPLLRRNLDFMDRNLRGQYVIHIVWNEETRAPTYTMRNHEVRMYALSEFIAPEYSVSHPLVYTGKNPRKPGYWRQQVIKLCFPEPTRWCIDTKCCMWRPMDLTQYDALHRPAAVKPDWITSVQEYGKPDEPYITHTPFLIRDTVYDRDLIMDTVQNHLERHKRGFSEFVYYAATTEHKPTRICAEPGFSHHRQNSALLPFLHKWYHY